MSKIFVLTLSLLFATGSSAMAFDTCIYVDRAGDILRLDPRSGTAELSSADHGELKCELSSEPQAIVQFAACQDRPEERFVVFTGASDQWLAEDDILVFRNKIWYQKCAFTR